MNTDVTQSQLVVTLQQCQGQDAATCTGLLTSLLALNVSQSSSMLVYFSSLSQADLQTLIYAVGGLTVADYPVMLPTVATKTPIDIGVMVNGFIELTPGQMDVLEQFLLPMNAVQILVTSQLLPTQSKEALTQRMINLFPAGWASDTAKQPGGNLYTLLLSLSKQLEVVSTLVRTTQESFYLSEVQGSVPLDFVVADFFGDTLPRQPGESDDHYRARAYGLLFQTAATRPAIQKALNAIAPTRLIEPWNPADTGAFDWISYYDYDTEANPARYTDASLAYQGFADISISDVLNSPLFPYTVTSLFYPQPSTTNPEVNGGSQTGRTLLTKGWSPNLFIPFNTSLLLTTGQVVTTSTATTSDGSGNATLTLLAPILAAAPDSSLLLQAASSALAYLDFNSYYLDLASSSVATQNEVAAAIAKTKAEGTMIWVRYI
jgi:hypothetical protein